MPTIFMGGGEICNHNIDPSGRCYDHNFQRKIGVFIENQCYDHIFLQ
jgi:hypothetical protein